MGLDMYLERKHYINSDERDRMAISGITENIDAAKVKIVAEEVGYWRKVNAIHNWFVEHVQGGVDECQESDVSKEQLQELLDRVNRVLESSTLVKGKVLSGREFRGGEMVDIFEEGKVIKDPSLAQELLPTQSGFFFGSTDYDEYYIEDLQETQTILSEALAYEGSGWYVYQASW